MRFRLKFQVDHDYGSILPLNYQLEVYRLIRDVLMDDMHAFKSWLSYNDVVPRTKQQLFNFSNLIVLERKIYGDRMLILSDTVELTISFLYENETENMVLNAFDRLIFTIGDMKSRIRLKVIQIEKLSQPVFSSSMSFIARSPIVLQNFETTKYVRFLSPTEDDYLDNFIDCLVEKYENFNDLPISNMTGHYSMQLITDPKSKLLEISSNQKELIKGYLFRFNITAPVELLEIGYKIGFGDKNHLGFGFCDILYNDKKIQPVLEENSSKKTEEQENEERKALISR